MIGFDVDDEWKNPPKSAYGNYNLWRLMIDKAYQGRGFGKEAMRLALEFVMTFPCGKAKYCIVSYEPGNIIARDLYHSFGFIENGEIDEGEVVAVKKL